MKILVLDWALRKKQGCIRTTCSQFKGQMSTVCILNNYLLKFYSVSKLLKVN